MRTINKKRSQKPENKITKVMFNKVLKKDMIKEKKMERN